MYGDGAEPAITFPPELVEAIARRTAELIAEAFSSRAVAHPSAFRGSR